jgi:hypothetical protein
MATIIFQQGTGAGNNWDVGGWGTNFTLHTTFTMPYGDNVVASITFIYDGITAKWTEVGRSSNADLKAAADADSTAAVLADLVTDFNDLLAKLRAAGVVAT